MRSKTSFFNKTIYKKNLTRFAPVWGLYTLCLVLGVVLLYSNGGTMKQFHFAKNYINDMFSIMAVVNLGYALLVAQLLFGDLYNSRMCNMLHAFPINRESWFITNVVSGLTFSLVPTAVMALVAAPLLMGSIFENAVVLSPLVFLAANLEFVCFFGMASFAAMCTANRFTMAAGYGLLNAGAMIAYWLIDTVYTPMLYGVITPVALMWNLTPMYHMSERQFVESTASFYDLREIYGDRLEGAVAQFTITDQWPHLWIIAGVGILFALLALILYKKRDLECAGDAVAFSWLVPVFEVLCAVFVATATEYTLENLLYIEATSRWTLFLGLIVGWFIATMLVERSARVFRPKNCTGLLILSAVFGVSLALTHFDVLGIEDYIPAASKVKSVQLATDWSSFRKMEDVQEIEAMLDLQRESLAERVENSGTYLLGYDGSWVFYVDTNDHLYDKEDKDTPYKFAASVNLTYELTNGKIIKRRYNVWAESPAGEIANTHLNSWDELNDPYEREDGTMTTRLEEAMKHFEMIDVGYVDPQDLPEICRSKDATMELLQCIDRDLQEGHMAQHPYFHRGCFRYEDEWAEDGYSLTDCTTINIGGKKTNWYVNVYPDATHTLRWLRSHDLLDWQILENDTIWR